MTRGSQRGVYAEKTTQEDIANLKRESGKWKGPKPKPALDVDAVASQLRQNLSPSMRERLDSEPNLLMAIADDILRASGKE